MDKFTQTIYLGLKSNYIVTKRVLKKEAEVFGGEFMCAHHTKIGSHFLVCNHYKIIGDL